MESQRHFNRNQKEPVEMTSSSTPDPGARGNITQYTSDNVMKWRKLLHRPNSVKPGVDPAGHSAQPVLFECYDETQKQDIFRLTNRGAWKKVRNSKLREKAGPGPPNHHEKVEEQSESHCETTTTTRATAQQPKSALDQESATASNNKSA